MPLPNPEHLLDQAERLIARQGAGPPRQADLRRAISASYYAVFHTLAAALADQFAGSRSRATATYALIYRSIDHSRLKSLATDLAKTSPPARFLAYLPGSGMGSNFASVALQFAELQEKRHEADYDPLVRVKVSDARGAIRSARSAITRFGLLSPARRRAFLALLAFQPRSMG